MIYSCIEMITYLCIYVASTYICCSYVQYIYIHIHIVSLFLCVYGIYAFILSKEVQKSNFRQYGQMKSRAGQRQREEKD